MARQAARGPHAWIGLLVVVGGTLAGCVQHQGDTSEPRALEENVARVRGVVVSDEILPVVGANVTVAGVGFGETDERGAFEIAGVPIGGRYTLYVKHSSYEPYTQELEVASDVVELRIGLVGIPGSSPYLESFINEGYVACMLALVYGSFAVPGAPCPFGQPVLYYKYSVKPDWTYSFQELDWRASEEMGLVSSPIADCRIDSPCYALIKGHAPLRIVARPNDLGYAKQYSSDGKSVFPEGNFSHYLVASYAGYLRQEINGTFYNQCAAFNAAVGAPRTWGCLWGVGLATGFRVTFYHTTFYLQSPSDPELFTAVPDR